MEQVHTNENKIEKPPMLYHGSSNKNIEEFEPRPTTFNHSIKDNFIVATPYYKKALPYLFDGEINGERKSWNSGVFGDGEIFAVIPVSEEDFRRNDKGGAIYKMSPEFFDSSEDRKEYEWFSTVPVKPLEVEIFESILETWKDEGINAYFLTEEQYQFFRTISTGDEKQKYLHSVKEL
ncbi:MAG: hypothetical protein KBC42_02110 [Candidatus Pacebacteria bacterium]|mgnify:FL=1|jgi:hypothetical protein|nr:hypothetical protein [Candidatus Paceibacterota bacterium]MBP9780697.1 hypothetical protein [Candidatus Paceibacterota bacterium]